MKLSIIEKIVYGINGWIFKEGNYYINCKKHGSLSIAVCHGYEGWIECLKCIQEKHTLRVDLL